MDNANKQIKLKNNILYNQSSMKGISIKDKISANSLIKLFSLLRHRHTPTLTSMSIFSREFELKPLSKFVKRRNSPQNDSIWFVVTIPSPKPCS